MTDFKSIIEEVEKFVSNYLKNELSSNLTFHNYSHTKEVVFSAQELCTRITSSELKKEVIILAAWFHDCGYSSTYKGHEEESCYIATDFLKSKNVPSHSINAITDCIMATAYPQLPKTLEDKILCDADFFHFARADYDRHEQQLRKEWELCLGRIYTDAEWHEQNCKLLSKHQYFTDYGKEVLQKFKEVNIEMMKCRI
jgi:predicted metal-dependent HD superfamily phosphohydrolase